MFSPYKLTDLDFEYADKWKKISRQLRIEITAPFELPVEEGEIVFAVLIEQFGKKEFPNGTLLRVMPEENYDSKAVSVIHRAATENGFISSLVTKYHLEFLDKDTLVNHILNCSDWLGHEAMRPSWHNGYFKEG